MPKRAFRDSRTYRPYATESAPHRPPQHSPSTPLTPRDATSPKSQSCVQGARRETKAGEQAKRRKRESPEPGQLENESQKTTSRN
eukprot:7133541-Prymnesium_polylepis.1